MSVQFSCLSLLYSPLLSISPFSSVPSVQNPTSARACIPVPIPFLTSTVQCSDILLISKIHTGPPLSEAGELAPSTMSDDTGAEREDHRRSPPHPEPINVGSAQGTNLMPLGMSKTTSPEEKTDDAHQSSNEDKKNSSKPFNEGNDKEKTETSKKDMGRKQKELSNERRRKKPSSSKKSTEDEYPDLFGQPFHLNDDGTVDTTGRAEEKATPDVAEKQAFDGNICHPAISFSPSEEDTIEQGASKYRALLHEYMQKNISAEERSRRYADHLGHEFWGNHVDVLSQTNFHRMSKPQLWSALEIIVQQHKVLLDNKALTLDMAQQLQKTHEDDQKLITQLSEKVCQQEELIRTLTAKADYNGQTADALRRLAVRQRDRVNDYREETRALRLRNRREGRDFDADELLSTFKPYEEVVKNTAALKKADSSKEDPSEKEDLKKPDSSKEDSSGKHDSSKKERNQKETGLPTNVTFEEFVQMASPSRSRSRTVTPPPDDQDVIDLDSSPEDDQKDPQEDQTDQQTEEENPLYHIDKTGFQLEVPLFSHDPSNILNQDCVEEDDLQLLADNNSTRICHNAYANARRWSRMTKYRNWAERTLSDVEDAARTKEGREQLRNEVEHINLQISIASKNFYAASSSDVKTFIEEHKRDRSRNSRYFKEQYMFLGPAANYKLKKLAAFDPDTPVLFACLERLRLIKSALDGKTSDIRLEYFQLFGKTPETKLSDQKYPNHHKPKLTFNRLKKRPRSPRNSSVHAKRQHVPSARYVPTARYVPSAQQDYHHHNRRHERSPRDDHRRHDRRGDHRRHSRNNFQPSSNTRQQQPSSDRNLKAKAEQIARKMVSNPDICKHYPHIPTMDIATMTLLGISQEEAMDRQYQHYKQHLMMDLNRLQDTRPANHNNNPRRPSREEFPRHRDMRSRSPSPGERPH